jgi:ribosomal protein S27AE
MPFLRRLAGEPAKTTTMTCPKCHSSSTSEYMENRWRCFKCGTRFIYDKAPSVVVQPTIERVIHTGNPTTNGGVLCPKCGTSDTQKVSVLYEQGTSQSTGVATIRSGNYAWNAQTVGTQQTNLARRFTPPVGRKWEKWCSDEGIGVVLGIGFAAFVCALLIGGFSLRLFTKAENWTDVDIGGGVLGMTALVGIPIGIGVSRLISSIARSNRKYNQNVYQPAMDRWQKSWVCMRCGAEFIPR